MIRMVRPKYEVSVESYFHNKLTDVFEWAGVKSLGYFKSNDEIEKIKQQYLNNDDPDVKYAVNVALYLPLDQEL